MIPNNILSLCILSTVRGDPEHFDILVFLDNLSISEQTVDRALKVVGKSVGLCKTTKRKDQLYISLLVSVWRIIYENFNPNGLVLAEI